MYINDVRVGACRSLISEMKSREARQRELGKESGGSYSSTRVE